MGKQSRPGRRADPDPPAAPTARLDPGRRVRILRGRRLVLAFGAIAVIAPIVVLAVLVWVGMNLVV